MDAILTEPKSFAEHSYDMLRLGARLRCVRPEKDIAFRIGLLTVSDVGGALYLESSPSRKVGTSSDVRVWGQEMPNQRNWMVELMGAQPGKFGEW